MTAPAGRNVEPPPRRPRFSLLALLLLTTVVALAVVVALQWRELQPLRDEVRRLRNEVGELTVDDPGKFHAIRVETDNRFEWKWRIWIPAGARYKLHAVSEAVPAAGYPEPEGTISLSEPGEHVVRYLIRRDPRDDRWYGALTVGTTSVGKDRHDWVEWNSTMSQSAGVSRTTREFEPSETVLLYRLRVADSDKTDEIADPAPGFLIWLEPRP